MNEAIAKMCDRAAEDSERFHMGLVVDLWNNRATQARVGKVTDKRFRDWLMNIRDYYMQKDMALAKQAEHLAETYKE